MTYTDDRNEMPKELWAQRREKNASQRYERTYGSWTEIAENHVDGITVKYIRADLVEKVDDKWKEKYLAAACTIDDLRLEIHNTNIKNAGRCYQSIPADILHDCLKALEPFERKGEPNCLVDMVLYVTGELHKIRTATSKCDCDGLVVALEGEIKILSKELDLINHRAKEEFLDKKPMIISIHNRMARLEKALAAHKKKGRE